MKWRPTFVAIAMAMTVLLGHAQDKSAHVSDTKTTDSVRFDDSTTEDEGKQRNVTVNVRGVLKRVDDVQNDSGSTWSTSDYTLEESSQVTFYGAQKADVEAKKYEPIFSGKAGPGEGGGNGGGTTFEDYEWTVNGEYNVYKLAIDAYIYGESDRKIADVHTIEPAANVVASGYVKFVARIEPEIDASNLTFTWSINGGKLVAPTSGAGLDEIKWDGPDLHQKVSTLKLAVSGGPLKGTLEQEANLKTIRPFVVRVKFVDDRWNEEQQITDGNDPEYDRFARESRRYFPVCYVKRRGMQVEVDVAGSVEDESANNLTMKTPIKLTAEAKYGFSDNESGQSQAIANPFRRDARGSDIVDDNTTDWSKKDYSQLVLESRRNVPNKVTEYEDFIMNWTFKVKNSSGSWINSYTDATDSRSMATNHVQYDYLSGKKYGLYLIYDVTRVPADEFTKSHLDYACNEAKDQRTISQIASKIGPDATGEDRFDLEWGITARHRRGTKWLHSEWDVLDRPAKADCITLSIFMRSALRLLGIRSARAGVVLPRHKSWDGLWVVTMNPRASLVERPETPLVPGDHLLFWMNGAENEFEGCCYVAGQWWMGGLGSSESSPYDVWSHCVGSNSDGLENDHQCWLNDLETAVEPPDGRP